MKRVSVDEAALLLRRLLDETDNVQSSKGKRFSRARISKLTLKRLFFQDELDPQFVERVGKKLLEAGWVLFPAGKMYGVVEAHMVDNWIRISSKLIGDDLSKVGKGKFDFVKLQKYFDRREVDGDDDYDGED